MKTFDASKFRKKVLKSIPGVSLGFNDPKTWLSTGCYALNYLISGNFKGGVPLEGKFTMFAGDSGSGKSYIVSANIVKDAQAKGIFCILVDTENALDESWLHSLDVDTSDEKLLKISGATVDDVTATLIALIDGYKADHDDTPYAERPPILIIIDSLGMLITPTQVAQAEAGDMKGDLGIKAKQITHMMRVLSAKIATQPIGLLATNHVFAAADKYSPDSIPGGKMLEFASSVIVQMNKFLLKEDEEGNKLADGGVAGIRSTCVVRKSRYSKPFERIKVSIPYETGMDPYSGLFDLFEKKGVIVKDGARYTYTSPVTGEISKDWRKNFKKLGFLDTIMTEWEHWEDQDTAIGFDETGSEDEENA